MKKVVLLVAVCFTQLFADSPFTGERSFLKKLGDFEKRRADDSPLPYLVVSTAQAYKVPQDILYNTVKADLLKGKTDLASVKKKEDIKIPDISVTGSELDGINQCTQSYCAIKLLNGTEKSRIETAPNKVEMFRQFLFERISAYVRLGEVRGSEGVISNLETLRAGFSQLGFIKENYPQTYRILLETVLNGKKMKAVKPFIGSFLNFETIHLQADKVKPVLRISEIFEFDEGDTKLFYDLHVYSNHFFDSSMRVIEVQKHKYDGMPGRVIVTDVMEVDELKKSGLIRALFKGKMIDGIRFYQDTLLDRVKKEVEK